MRGNASNRIATVAVAVPAVIAAIVSYEHMREVATVAGEDWRAWLLPLSVDGLVVASSIAAVTSRNSGIKVRRMTVVNLLVGLFVSVGANVLVPFLEYLSIVGHQVLSAAVAAWPAVALALAFEEVLRLWGSRAEAEVPEAVAEVVNAEAPEAEVPEAVAEVLAVEAEAVAAEAEPVLPTRAEPAAIADSSITVPVTGSAREAGIAAALADPSLTGKALGEMFPSADGRPRSDSWGRQIKRAAASLAAA